MDMRCPTVANARRYKVGASLLARRADADISFGSNHVRNWRSYGVLGWMVLCLV